MVEIRAGDTQHRNSGKTNSVDSTTDNANSEHGLDDFEGPLAVLPGDEQGE